MASPRWDVLNQQLGGAVSGMAQRQNQEREMKQALALLLFKAQIKQQEQQQNPNDQMNQLRLAQALQQMGQQQQFNRKADIAFGGQNPTAQEVQSILPAALSPQMQNLIAQKSRINPQSPTNIYEGLRQNLRNKYFRGQNYQPTDKGWKQSQSQGGQSVAQQKFDLQRQEVSRVQKASYQMAQESAQDVLDTISEVEKGINNFGVTGSLPSLPGTTRAEWEANVNKLLSSKIVDLITKMKQASKTGATGFGQLSDKEGQLLREASTALKRNLSPGAARKYLNVMKQSAYKVLNPSEQTDLDQTPGQQYMSSMEGGNQVKREQRQLDENNAALILQRVGGDKNKARALARQMGYSF